MERNRMDTSKLYIEMCEQATEIQEMWKPEEGDIVYSKILNVRMIRNFSYNKTVGGDYVEYCGFEISGFKYPIKIKGDPRMIEFELHIRNIEWNILMDIIQTLIQKMLMIN
jgi:hypothetical protein